MTKLVTTSGTLKRFTHALEEDFERAVVANAPEIFGPDCFYLDCKKKIGRKRGKRNIPDGYLVDLRNPVPQLWVIENELITHDLFNHIGIQLLEFSYSYGQSKRLVKDIVLEEINLDERAKTGCTEHIAKHDYRSLDHLVEAMLFQSDFRALVIIDDLGSGEIDEALAPFSFHHPVIEFVTYRNAAGDFAYRFTPFYLEQDETDASSVSAPRALSAIDRTQLDTIVVPARKDGFERTFLGENRWYAIRMNSSMLSQVKYIAGYQVGDVSAITHVAPVKRIVPWQQTGKYCVEFAEAAEAIEPIKRTRRGRGSGLQSARYTNYAVLRSAKNLAQALGDEQLASVKG